MARVDALTGMRGLASLMVVGYHAVLIVWLHQIAEGAPADAFEHPLSVWGLGGGWLGVDFFFVLSGFLLAGPLLRHPEGLGRHGYRSFAVKRFLRIAPPYYVAIAVAYVAAGWSDDPVLRFTAKGVLTHLAYVHTFFPLEQFSTLVVAWTLGVELQFYLFLPLFVLPFRRYGPVVVLAFAAAAVAYLAWAHDPDYARNRFLVFQFPAFLGHFGAGIAVAQLVERGWRTPVHPDLVIAAAFVGLIAVPALLLGYTTQFEPVDDPLYTYFVRLLAGLFFALLVLFALQERSLAGRFFALRPLVWVGEASYSLYLVHFSVGACFLVTGADWALRGVFTFACVLTVLSLVAAAAFYYAVERPSLRLKEAVSRRLGGVPRPRGLDPAP